MGWGIYSILIIGLACSMLYEILCENEQRRYWRRRFEQEVVNPQQR